jgi:predicted hotdog family 3-hydroxylacyl-ACP dehydratase
LLERICAGSVSRSGRLAQNSSVIRLIVVEGSRKILCLTANVISINTPVTIVVDAINAGCDNRR